jgi:naphtho-gamma-pyrone polyketide synthase
MEKFIQKALPPDARTAAVAVHAPYHASHLFSEEDIDEILSGVENISNMPSTIRLISGSSGDVAEGLSFGELLRRAVRDMLILPLDLTNVSRAIAQLVEAPTAAASWTVLPIGTSLGSSILSSVAARCRDRCAISTSIDDAVSQSAAPSPSSSSTGRPHESKIAIIGMAGRFPYAADLSSFWDLLYRGLDVHREVPADRFDARRHYDAAGRRKNTSRVLHGCWIREPGLFDARFFNISPKEAEQSDPGQRLALETAYEALEMAGVVPDRTPSTRRERVGVFYGMTSDDWREVNSGQDVDTYFIPGSVHPLPSGPTRLTCDGW